MFKNKLHRAYQRINDLRNDLENEGKSTAGDKHETGRAMIQLEMEQQGLQLKKFEQQLMPLQNLPLNNSEKVILGSLVDTNVGEFFIAVSIGNVEVNERKIMVISPQSPIGEMLMNRKAGDKFNFREKEIEVLNVI